MKQLGPIMAALFLVGAIIGGFAYHRNLYKTNVTEPSISSTMIEESVIKSAAENASLYITKLNRTGQVPVNADSLSKNPTPLFNATE